MHTGANPWLQEELFGKCLRGGFFQPEDAAERLLRDSSLELFLKELGPAVRKAAVQACKRYMKGEPPVGHVVISCERGRHRSYALGHSTVDFATTTEAFESELLVHHCRPIPGYDDRDDCGCAAGWCKYYAKKDQHLIAEEREKVRSVLRPLFVRFLGPEYHYYSQLNGVANAMAADDTTARTRSPKRASDALSAGSDGAAAGAAAEARSPVGARHTARRSREAPSPRQSRAAEMWTCPGCDAEYTMDGNTDRDWHASVDSPWCSTCDVRLRPPGFVETPEQREERCEELNLCRECELNMDDPSGLHCMGCGRERYCLGCSGRCYACWMRLCPECLGEHFCEAMAERLKEEAAAGGSESPSVEVPLSPPRAEWDSGSVARVLVPWAPGGAECRS